MDPLLSQALAAAGLGTPVIGYVAAAVTICSVLDAVIPQPAPGSHWLPARKLLSMVALNLGAASNGKQPPFASWLLRVAMPLIQAQMAAQAAPQRIGPEPPPHPERVAVPVAPAQPAA